MESLVPLPAPVPLSVWTDLFDPGEPAWSKILRTVAVYLVLLILLRIDGKRELGQLSTLDLIVLLLLSNTVQNAIIGDDFSLTGGIIGALVLIVLDRVLSGVCYRFPRFARLVAGKPTPLIAVSNLVPEDMRKQGITTEELAALAQAEILARLSAIKHLLRDAPTAQAPPPTNPSTAFT